MVKSGFRAMSYCFFLYVFMLDFCFEGYFVWVSVLFCFVLFSEDLKDVNLCYLHIPLEATVATFFLNNCQKTARMSENMANKKSLHFHLNI